MLVVDIEFVMYESSCTIICQLYLLVLLG